MVFTWRGLRGWLRLGIVISLCWIASILGYVSYEIVTSHPSIIEEKGFNFVLDSPISPPSIADKFLQGEDYPTYGYNFLWFIPGKTQDATGNAKSDRKIMSYVRVVRVNLILLAVGTALCLTWVLVLVIPVLIWVYEWVLKGFRRTTIPN